MYNVAMKMIFFLEIIQLIPCLGSQWMLFKTEDILYSYSMLL